MQKVLIVILELMTRLLSCMRFTRARCPSDYRCLWKCPCGDWRGKCF